jgi:uncharacterized protein
MTFNDISPGTSIFVDANVLIFHFAPDPSWGPPCRLLLDRIMRQEIQGFTTPDIVSDVAHRLMTLEAVSLFGWPSAGIVYRLKKNFGEIAKLSLFHHSVQDISALGLRMLTPAYSSVLAATGVSLRYGLLSGDALIVSVMQDHGLTHLASHDADFDRVPGLMRYAPA